MSLRIKLQSPSFLTKKLAANVETNKRGRTQKEAHPHVDFGLSAGFGENPIVCGKMAAQPGIAIPSTLLLMRDLWPACSSRPQPVEGKGLVKGAYQLRYNCPT
jgi:hypothetical protein